MWICKLVDETKDCANYGDREVDFNEMLELVEANDNHIEYHTVGEFIEFCIHGQTNKSGK